MTGTTPDSHAPVAIVVAESRAIAVDSALSAMGTAGTGSLASPIVVVAANEDTAAGGFAQIIGSLLATPDRIVRIAVPERLSTVILRRVARRGGRASSSTLPAEVVGAATLVAANDLRGETATRPTIVIGMWSRFAGARRRIGVRISTPEQGLAAEIALTVRPTVILLADVWHGRPLVVATSDQIAAELVGLAIRQAMGDGDDELGPWQDPLVQRATELDLGVRIPAEIAIRASSVETGSLTAIDDFPQFVAGVAARLGVNNVACDRVESSILAPSRMGNDSGGLV
jgi:hypothetical protein